MTIETYLRELASETRLRGRTRRRFLTECRDHLIDASADLGAEDAVSRFGDARVLARAYDTAIAVRRSLRATVVTAVAVLAVAVSTQVVLDGADPSASAVLPWAVVFFGAAQTASVALALTMVLAVTMTRGAAQPADVLLLVRRAFTAVVSASVTLFAAAAALPGYAPAWQVLAGPVLAVVAVGVHQRVCSLARAIDPLRRRVVHEEVTDVLALLRRRAPSTPRAAPRASVGLAVTVVAAAAGAFSWDHLDQGTTATSAIAAGAEAAMVLTAFVLLGGALGLRPAGWPRSVRLAKQA